RLIRYPYTDESVLLFLRNSYLAPLLSQSLGQIVHCSIPRVTAELVIRSFRNSRRARGSPGITVPTGISRISDASRYENSSTTTSHNTSRCSGDKRVAAFSVSCPSILLSGSK